MPIFTYIDVSITSAAEAAAGQTITLATLNTTPGASEGRNTSNVVLEPNIEIKTRGDRLFYVSSLNQSGGLYVSFVVKASDSGATLPINANIIITTFDIVSSVSNAKSSTNARVRRILKDTGTTDVLKLLLDAELNERIDDASHIYSDDKPRKLSRNIVGDNEHDYALSSDYQADFSQVRSVEYPGGEFHPQFLDDDQWIVYEPDDSQYTTATISSSATEVKMSTISEAVFFEDGDMVEIGDDDASEEIRIGTNGNTTTGVVVFKSGQTASATYSTNPYIKLIRVLRLPNYTPLASEFVKTRLTARHIHTDSQDTIPVTDYEAFTHLCASLAAESIANKFRISSDSSVPSDSVEHLTQATLWMEAVKEHRDIYDSHIGKASEQVVAYAASIDLDTSYQWGRDFLFHPRGWSR
ncbi:hypothetical protein LCGC14_1468960 [marine sediment metagenome]|uniref:Uncharacterized protein n=1 Tax=marine sediment metagenome TaxID=412755 RepID=A0A0F9JCX7_9ZZZZ